LTIQALVTLLYGFAMAGGGFAGYRRAGSVPSLAGGAGIGGLALLGGLLMFFGNETGRGLALFGAVLAILFFGWKLSRGILNRQPVGRAGGILAISLLEVSVLLIGGR
jgi:uncharacterized membrane protein (UPF0136 family)